MSNSEESLRQRFRVALAERTRAIQKLLTGTSGPPTGAHHKELMGLLHTLKGEARMLGLRRLASICHALEDQLLSPELDLGAALSVVDAMSLAMAETTSDAQCEELLQTAGEALGLEFVSEEGSESGGGPPVDLPANSVAVGVSPSVERWVQVDALVVERLGETLAALSVDFSEHLASLQSSTPHGDAFARAEELRERLKGALGLALELRLTSIEPLLASLGASARLLGKERGKSVKVEVRAAGVRVERDVLQLLREPLLHLCTNAVVHGLEPPEHRGDKPLQGLITLSAESVGAGVVVRVSDDGRGIERRYAIGQALHASGVSTPEGEGEYDYVFESGFSTHDGTDEVAGRGVGLDVVKRQIEAMGGRVELRSKLGSGTHFSLFVPALLTQQDVVVFQHGKALYGVAAHHVLTILTDIGTESPSVHFEGDVIPIRTLGATPPDSGQRSQTSLLVLRLGDHDWALRVGQLLGHFEVIRRPSTAVVRARTGIEASAQLDDGRLVLLLSPRYMEQRFRSAQRTGREAEATQPAAGGRKRVLVVDDSVVVRDLIAEVLVSTGYEVHTADDGQSALEEIDRFQPGLVVSDIEMPNMDGFELLAAIRQRSHTLPVIMVTARSSAKDRQRASTLGASAYIAKGEFQRDSLVATIDRYYPKVT